MVQRSTGSCPTAKTGSREELLLPYFSGNLPCRKGISEDINTYIIIYIYINIIYIVIMHICIYIYREREGLAQHQSTFI